MKLIDANDSMRYKGVNLTEALMKFALITALSLFSALPAFADSWVCVTSPDAPQFAFAYESSVVNKNGILVPDTGGSRMESVTGDNILKYLVPEFSAGFQHWKNIKSSDLEDELVADARLMVTMASKGEIIFNAPYLTPHAVSSAGHIALKSELGFTFNGKKVSALRYDFCGKD